MKKIIPLFFIFAIVMFFLSCASTHKPYTTQDITLKSNGDILHYYFFTDESALWSYCRPGLKDEFGITVPEDSLNKMKNSSWTKDDDLDAAVKDYMIMNSYGYGLFVIAESETKNDIIINRLLNNQAYKKIFKIEKPTTIEANVTTKFSPWMLLFL